jgi:hypothetical protein
MIEFVKKTNKNNLILFVHGFIGGSDTWKNDEQVYFYELLAKDGVIADNFDIAKFEYFSKLLNIFATTATGLSRLANLFATKITKSEKNLGISELSELLSTQLRFVLHEYQNVIVIAHSMGGLITKCCVVNDIEQSDSSKVKLIISLAVPHLGSDTATYGGLLSGNLQIKDLAPLGKFCPHLNNKWLQLNDKPTIKYFYGSYDGVVKKESAVGTDSVTQDTIACPDDHTTICKPKDETSIAVVAVRHFLTDFLKNQTDNAFAVHKLKDENQFSDEYFALKLLLADVHSATVKHSKEHFLNAEYARKFFSSNADQKKLTDLYTRIRTVYQDCYDKHASNGALDGGKLVAEVHQKIVSEDSLYLKTALPLIHALHKKGMMHQLANDLSDDVWWNDNRSLEALESIKATFEKDGVPNG